MVLRTHITTLLVWGAHRLQQQQTRVCVFNEDSDETEGGKRMRDDPAALFGT